MARDWQDLTYRGRRRWAGNYGRVWVDGDLIFEIVSFECTVTPDREDVIIGISKDSKVVSLTGKGNLVIKKVYNRGFHTYLENQKAGLDIRFQIVAKLADPDMIDAQNETIQIDNVWLEDELQIMQFEKATVVETTINFAFTPEDLFYRSTVEL